ncbi:RNA polymerase sigma factor [Flavihumibacter profundi]|uniref:RNA polymerase sigma factor n=1 Tax=Flavihumibacter profundi TaxID=2716883 RepID=UPI001CC6A0AF|nr:sigma-70 family RNA polymerase sigma factor [Flavihumibacter profundi]MBZ5856796.1 sigma-70 family RNA polymerase sigma factor [Flavihumibacter profundi]
MNDRKSQEKLYKQFYPAFFALCKTFFSDNHDILTALNNGMLKIFRNIGQYDPSRGEFFNWCYTIIRNAALTLVRDKRANLTVELKDDLNVYTTINPFRQFEWKDIYVYLDKLPAGTRAVCSLFYLEGYNIREIGEALELKDGTVKWHLNECRNKLKVIFEQSPIIERSA